MAERQLRQSRLLVRPSESGQAAEQGEPQAQCNLADMYEHGRGVQQDYALALKWYQKSAAQGVAEALYSLGGMYEKGLGVTADKQLAAEWWGKAAALGFEDARKRLAAMVADPDRNDRI